MESETSPIPAWFKIEDGHQVMYCDVPKMMAFVRSQAASTNLKRLMLILSGKFDIADLLSIPGTVVHHQNIMRNLAVFESATFSENGVGNYTKFIFVRHPFERLVSAYENKVGINAVDFNYRKRLGPKMIRKYRQEPTKVWEEGDYATFVEFVDYVIEEWKLNKTHMDVHWLPANDLCIPCTIEYDLIGKVETLEQDVSFLLHKLNETDLIASFQAQQNAPQTTPSVWRRMMKQLSQQQIYDLLTIYAADFHIFGYLPDYPV
ncbi:carbohydrate sulfotransferase 11-like [Daphnia carinata]|uniref:carbohydrate sulfotransferase 11-like n=1 Tax=Daphnia carinata TaxID=120202 RepID=UPI0028691906|nr:carbohydrate sulfotransferase 11-like [Daphnia carinata]